MLPRSTVENAHPARLNKQHKAIETNSMTIMIVRNELSVSLAGWTRSLCRVIPQVAASVYSIILIMRHYYWHDTGWNREFNVEFAEYFCRRIASLDRLRVEKREERWTFPNIRIRGECHSNIIRNNVGHWIRYDSLVLNIVACIKYILNSVVLTRMRRLHSITAKCWAADD